MTTGSAPNIPAHHGAYAVHTTSASGLWSTHLPTDTSTADALYGLPMATLSPATAPVLMPLFPVPSAPISSMQAPYQPPPVASSQASLLAFLQVPLKASQQVPSYMPTLDTCSKSTSRLLCHVIPLHPGLAHGIAASCLTPDAVPVSVPWFADQSDSEGSYEELMLEVDANLSLNQCADLLANRLGGCGSSPD